MVISIHAPREGSDGKYHYKIEYSHKFLSTLPVRGATAAHLKHKERFRFLSTLPVRGATRAIERAAGIYRISIHAPREGSDSICARASTWSTLFLSTLPVRGATGVTVAVTVSPPFLSTLPVRGATDVPPVGPLARRISIHAPREGSDVITTSRNHDVGDFYPRSP